MILARGNVIRLFVTQGCNCVPAKYSSLGFIVAETLPIPDYFFRAATMCTFLSISITECNFDSNIPKNTLMESFLISYKFKCHGSNSKKIQPVTSNQGTTGYSCPSLLHSGPTPMIHHFVGLSFHSHRDAAYTEC
jgi:hypothetical protein